MRKGYLDIHIVYTTIETEGEDGRVRVEDHEFCAFPTRSEAVRFRDQKEYLGEVECGKIFIKSCRLFKEAIPV